MTKQNLFNIPDFAEWEKAACKLAKVDDLSALNKTTRDGVVIKPLYTEAKPVSFPPRTSPIKNIARVAHPDVKMANAAALSALEGGAEGLVFSIASVGRPHGFGVDIKTQDNVSQLLQGIFLDLISVELEAGDRTEEIAALFINEYKARNLDISACEFHANFDPITVAAITGDYVKLDNKISAEGFLVDTRAAHQTGASEAQELAFALSSAAYYLKQNTSLQKLNFKLTTNQEQFLSIAKLRAFGLLLQKFTKAFIKKELTASLYAETSAKMLQAQDAPNNLLRTTLACFSAVIGGAEYVTPLAFTSPLGLPDDFAERLARNTAIILRDESHIAQVGDAAAGSFYIDSLTAEFAEKAWEEFQDIEKTGGIVANLKNNRLQKIYAESGAKEKADILGVTIYPNTQDKKWAVLMPANESVQTLTIKGVKA